MIGLTTAAVLSQAYDVKIIASKFGAETESVKATAIWHVYLVPETETSWNWAGVTLAAPIPSGLAAMAWPAHHASTRPATATGFTAMACNFPNRLNASRTSPDAEFSNMISPWVARSFGGFNFKDNSCGCK